MNKRMGRKSEIIFGIIGLLIIIGLSFYLGRKTVKPEIVKTKPEDLTEKECLEFSLECLGGNGQVEKKKINEADPGKQTGNTEFTETYQNGKASFYDRSICGLHGTIYQVNCYTANGNLFDDTSFTAACPARLLNNSVRVCHGGQCIEVFCNDTGAFEKRYGRVIDLSAASFEALAPLSKGIIPVEIIEL